MKNATPGESFEIRGCEWETAVAGVEMQVATFISDEAIEFLSDLLLQGQVEQVSFRALGNAPLSLPATRPGGNGGR